MIATGYFEKLDRVKNVDGTPKSFVASGGLIMKTQSFYHVPAENLCQIPSIY